MRVVLTSLVLATTLMHASGTPAAAHGGQYRGPSDAVPPGLRSPSDPMPPAPPPLGTRGPIAWPALPMSPETRAAHNLRIAEAEITDAELQGNLWKLDVLVTFIAFGSRGGVEGLLRCDHGPLCCVTSARMDRDGEECIGELKGRSPATQQYLHQLARSKDPLLVTRLAPGRFKVQAWPVTWDTFTTVELTVYAFDREPAGTVMRYVQGDECLLVVPQTHDHLWNPPAGVDWPTLEDARSGRMFVFLPATEAKTRFPNAPTHAVPCVSALRESLTNAKDLAWLGLPEPQ